MKKPLQAVLFDLDGTLIDTAPDFIEIIRQLCQKHRKTPPSDIAIREQVSAGARAMVRLILDQDFPDDDPILLTYRNEFLDIYAQNICTHSCLFAGMPELLHDLEQNQIAWGIVTNKPRHLAKSLLDALHLSHRCGVLVCPDDVQKPKPDPESLLLACQQLNVQPTHCIYIGDHVRDIVAGKAAGMTTVIAEYGYLSAQDRQNLPDWQADYIVQSPQKLHALLQNL